MHGRGRQAELLAQVRETHPPIGPQQVHDAPVGLFHTLTPVGDVDRVLACPGNACCCWIPASLYFRAFYGVPDQRESPTEHPTNAVRGFIDMLATLINAHHPTELVACWDNDWRPQWRVDLIPSYKAHRVAGVSDAVPCREEPDQEHPATGGLAEEVPDDLGPQVPLIVDALTAFGIARIGVDGYEADDVIGSLVARHKGRPIDVVSGDRDMLQLVDDAAPVRVLYTGKGGVREPDIGTEAMLREKYAVAHGEGYLEMSILRGDTSDGLPGVKGIGDKTAAQLISEFGSLAAIRAAVDNGDARLKGRGGPIWRRLPTTSMSLPRSCGWRPTHPCPTPT